MIDYGAAKAALVNLTKSLSQEFGAEGHPREHASRPARSSTDLWLGEGGVAETVGKAAGLDAAAVREQVGRHGDSRPAGSPRPRRWPRSSILLASPRTANVTGANCVIDGGLVKTT